MAVEDYSSTVPVPKDGARDNAILFRGDPISKLPTQRIFKYVSLSTTPPLGLEWVDDTNVVLVWSSVAEAQNAFHSMREAGTLEMDEDDEGFLPARPMPETLAPMELRLEKALGKAVQEAGQMWMRWARPEDVKVKGGKSKSKFYERYGENAGKEGQNVHVPHSGSGKRKRRDYEGDDRDDLRKKLDAEMDAFANGDETAVRRSISPRRGRSASPPRRGQTEQGGHRGRRRPGDYDYDRDLHSRLGPPVVPRGVREWDVGKEWETDEFGRATFAKDGTSSSNRNQRREQPPHRDRDREEGGGRRPRGEARPTRTKEDLDAELDAFLQA
ncbi:hypothetical protein M408DRAFT_331286 [Serendipita vermifera MAFF 305830]|uniref:Chromatin target of PRMT1 protein C-terminal domain-containing protein n=1 Tax=Serendipita vermifera MAFF 305830 TaxID=933852 RepID=A0A0C2WFJ4_SERVB|nr:hypothetical protein M408DRAFT_334228 [Serendipita vermifera MAFF 305830]KIM25173.1 hypothetical protein M408DRAFT_331286 [Serendipita vermifera MAFF 305830]